MKNFTLLFIALLSMSVLYAQNAHHPLLPGTQPTLPSCTKICLPAVNPVSTGNSSSERSANLSRSEGAEYDSIYSWQLNRTTKILNYNYKQINITYDANHNKLGYLQQTWDSGKWVNSVQLAYTYSGNLMTSETVQFWNDTVWVNDLQYTYSYNANNLDTSFKINTWQDSVWGKYYRQVITYAGNLDTSDIVEGWQDSIWVPTENFLYFYNAKKLDTAEVTSLWDNTVWSTDGRELFTYNAKDSITTELNQSYSGGNWLNSDLYTYTYYTTTGLDSGFLEQGWSGSWLNQEQDLYLYNANNLDTGTVEQLWNSAWQTLDLSSYSYNANNILVSVNYLDYSTAADTVVISDSTYYYLAGTAGVKQLSVNSYQLSVYPNPASDFIHTSIQLKQPSDLQLRLVNVFGQTVWSVDAGHVSNYQNDISVANLADGVYLLGMVTGSGMETREVVVAK